MDTEMPRSDLLFLLRSMGGGIDSVETERGLVNGTALKEGNRFHLSVWTLENPTVSPGERFVVVLERWADSPEEAARILQQSVLRHARNRKVLHEAQRRIYTAQSVLC